jgi:ribulose-bisphosphate carboxylase small chain|tara:strand:+ start:512 stop:931 length:420 start_codon:yes stop_codon:yes gene_type:complete
VRLTQGCFSFLPDLTDAQIEKQISYAISKGWAMNVEYTDDPHPRNNYWELWGLPLFDIKDVASVMFELAEARKAISKSYIRMNAFDASYGVESCVMSFLVNRPANEPGFWLDRQESEGRRITYTLKSYAVENNASGNRY